MMTPKRPMRCYYTEKEKDDIKSSLAADPLMTDDMDTRPKIWQANFLMTTIIRVGRNDTVFQHE